MDGIKTRLTFRQNRSPFNLETMPFFWYFLSPSAMVFLNAFPDRDKQFAGAVPGCPDSAGRATRGRRLASWVRLDPVPSLRAFVRSCTIGGRTGLAYSSAFLAFP